MTSDTMTTCQKQARYEMKVFLPIRNIYSDEYISLPTNIHIFCNTTKSNRIFLLSDLIFPYSEKKKTEQGFNIIFISLPISKIVVPLQTGKSCTTSSL